MRLSQAFAAFRTSVVESLLGDIRTELLPKFNSEVEDVRRRYEVEKGEAPALADHNKRARVMDMRVRQQQFIDSLNKEMVEKLTKRIEEYGGTITPKQIPDGDKGTKEVLEASFPDGSSARVPKALWIDYKQFHRV